MLCQPHNKQLQRTMIRRRGDGASAPFHYALAPRFTRQRAAAELRRYAAGMRLSVRSESRARVGREYVEEAIMGPDQRSTFHLCVGSQRRG